MGGACTRFLRGVDPCRALRGQPRLSASDEFFVLGRSRNGPPLLAVYERMRERPFPCPTQTLVFTNRSIDANRSVFLCLYTLVRTFWSKGLHFSPVWYILNKKRHRRPPRGLPEPQPQPQPLRVCVFSPPRPISSLPSEQRQQLALDLLVRLLAQAHRHAPPLLARLLVCGGGGCVWVQAMMCQWEGF